MLLDAIFFLPTLFTYGIIVLLIIILCFLVVYVSHKIYISIYDNLPLGHSSMNLTPKFSSIKPGRSELFTNQASVKSIWITNRSQIYDTKLVRIMISLESCYLAYVEFDIILPPRKSMPRAPLAEDDCGCPSRRSSRSKSKFIFEAESKFRLEPKPTILHKLESNTRSKINSFSRHITESAANANSKNTTATDPYVEPEYPVYTTIVKYYDQLSKIPKGKVMLKCSRKSLELSITAHMRSVIDAVIQNAAASRQTIPESSRLKLN